MVGFSFNCGRGDQILYSSSFIVLALSGEASVESSTFNCPRAEAGFVLFRVLGISPALEIHLPMILRVIFHVALGWGRAPRAGRRRLLGGFIHLPLRAALKRMHFCPFGLLSSAQPFMAMPHISPPLCGRCSLNLRSRARAWRSWRDHRVHAACRPHCTRNNRPCGLAHNLTYLGVVCSGQDSH